MTQTAELHSTHEHSLEYLASASIGRVVVSNRDEVFVIPVSYVAERDCLVFQVSPAWRKQVAECDRLVFHADGVDASTGIGWSVTVRGDYGIMSGFGSLQPPAGFSSATPLWQQHDDEASLWIRLHIDSIDIRESMRFAG
jgi:hypothetical protein